MKSMLKSVYTKPLIFYLSAALLAMSTAAGPAEAMFIPAAPYREDAASPKESAERAADLIKIRAALESKIIRQYLIDHGLSPDETMARINTLSDEQIHQLAAHTNSLQAGGQAFGIGLGIAAVIALVAFLVLVLIFLMQGRLEIT